MQKKPNRDRVENQSSSPEQVDLIKRAVRETFHEMKKIEDSLNNLQQIRNALKRDLIDLKDGRLDRIEHRQDIDSISKESSVFTVHQKVEIGGKDKSQWYVPYSILFRKDTDPPTQVTINNSIAKIHAGGACQLDTGEVKYL